MQIGIDPAQPGGDFTLTDLLYGEPLDGKRGVARPFVPGVAIFDCMEAKPGPDGVWHVEIDG